jgi:hypothetical protein
VRERETARADLVVLWMIEIQIPGIAESDIICTALDVLAV